MDPIIPAWMTAILVFMALSSGWATYRVIMKTIDIARRLLEWIVEMEVRRRSRGYSPHGRSSES